MDKKKQGAENREIGVIAEQLATDYLFSEGYSVRERNWRIGNRIEVDIIAEKNFTVAFVEVKSRKEGQVAALEAVNKNKRNKIMRAAEVYMRNLPMPYQYRFDIITVTFEGDNHHIQHIADAFMPGLNGQIR